MKFLPNVGFSQRILMKLCAILFFVCVFPVNLSGAEAFFSLRQKFCLTAHSVRTQNDVLVLANEALEKYLKQKCEILKEPVANPFSIDSRKRIRDEFSSSVLLFWLDEKSQDGEFLMRAIYLNPFLQFSMIKEKLPAGFSSESLQVKSEILTQKVSQLMEDLPFIGFVDGEGYVLWNSTSPFKFARDRFEPHGLLPLLLEWKPVEWKSAAGRIESDQRLGLKYPDREKLQLPLWMQKTTQ